MHHAALQQRIDVRVYGARGDQGLFSDTSVEYWLLPSA